MPISISTVDGREIEKWLTKGGGSEYPFASRVVRNPVCPRLCKPIRLPSLAEIHFLDDLNLGEARIEGPLDLSRCLFEKRLVLRNVQLEGDLRLDDVEILGKGSVVGADLAGLDLAGARLHGGMRAPRLNASRISLDASGAHFDHQVSFKGARVGNFQAPGAHIHGNLLLNADKRGKDIFCTEMQQLNLEIAEIHGDLILTALHVSKRAILRNARIEGDLFAGVLEGEPRVPGSASPVYRTEINDADFSDAELEGRLYLEGARIDSLSLAAADIRGGVEFKAARMKRGDGVAPLACQLKSLDLSSAKLGSDILFEGVAIGNLSTESAQVEGRLTVQSSSAWRKEEKISEQAFEQASSERDEWMKSAEFEKGAGAPVLSSDGFFRSTLGDFNGRSMTTRGAMYLYGLQIREDLSLIASALGGGLWIVPDQESPEGGPFPPEILGDLHLSAIRNSPYIEIKALRCAREVRAIAAQLGPTHLRLGLVRHNLLPCAVSLLVIEDTHIMGPLDLTLLQVDGNVTHAGRQGVWLDGCRIDGDLSFWSKSWLTQAEEDYPHQDLGRSLRVWDHGAAVVGPVRICCVIGGNCDLTLLKAQGPVSLDHSTIGGDLLLMSMATLAKSLTEVQQLLEPHPEAPHAPTFRAVTPALSLRATRVERDVDLTGLTLFTDLKNPWCVKEQCGHLLAPYLNVKGDLKGYECSEGGDEAYTVIPGNLDLSSAEVAHLAISGHSLEKQSSQEANTTDGGEDRRVILEGGHFRKVRFPHIKRGKDGSLVATDLADVEAQLWWIGEKEKEEPSVERYKDLLNSDLRTRRSTYRSIEHNLRNGGREDDANEIYRAMCIREHREALENNPSLLFHLVRGLKFPFFLIWRHLLRFGTDPLRLLSVIIVLALASVPIYRNSKNLEPSESSIAAAELQRATENLQHATEKLQQLIGERPQENRKVASPVTVPTTLAAERGSLKEAAIHEPSRSCSQWGPGDAILLLVRHHIPIPALNQSQKCELRHSQGLEYDLAFSFFLPHPEASRWSFRLPVSADHWADLMTALNFTMWPLVLAFALRRLLRQ
jgi:uncharacterized protein YjbI with pentapeptide repeats